eukprot:467127-Pleurochrysis_carterae.AAC.1
MLVVVLLEEVAWVKLGLRESLHLDEFSFRGAVPDDASCVSLAVQRLEQLPDVGDAPVVEASLSGRWSY